MPMPAHVAGRFRAPSRHHDVFRVAILRRRRLLVSGQCHRPLRRHDIASGFQHLFGRHLLRQWRSSPAPRRHGLAATGRSHADAARAAGGGNHRRQPLPYCSRIWSWINLAGLFDINTRLMLLATALGFMGLEYFLGRLTHRDTHDPFESAASLGVAAGQSMVRGVEATLLAIPFAFVLSAPAFRLLADHAGGAGRAVRGD